MRAIRKDLMQQRRTLSFTFNGVELIPAATAGANANYQLGTEGGNSENNSGGGTVDARNGPMPQSCTITPLTNTTFLIVYHITAWYWENLTHDGLNVTNNPGHPAVYNRWTETVEIDGTMQSRRIRDGKYMIRSDNTEGVTADELRSQLAVVGVPSGWVRESSRYTISPDGLALQYYIVDKELHKKLPPGAYEASGTYTESAPKLGAIVWGDVQLRLKGSPQTNFIVEGGRQFELVRTGIFICMEKLRRRGMNIEKGGFPDYCEVRVNMYENEVNFHFRARLTAQKSRYKTVAAFTGDLCTTPLSDDAGSQNNGPFYLDRGAYGLILQAAKYWDPDLRDTSLAPDTIIAPTAVVTSYGDNANVQHNNGVKVGKAGVEREV
jgi:hypothetical protein